MKAANLLYSFITPDKIRRDQNPSVISEAPGTGIDSGLAILQFEFGAIHLKLSDPISIPPLPRNTSPHLTARIINIPIPP
jgi:hypothetical protein